MDSYNGAEREEKEIEAMRLIDEAENLANKGKGNRAISLYEKAAQIYLEIGSYLKLDEIYIGISKKISQFKNNLQAIYRLESIIRKTEELQLHEISAKLYIQLGNIAYKMNDWETAGESYKKASDYLYDSDPEEYSNLSSFFLLKAGQALERSPTKKVHGKRLILKAIMKINKFDELYEMEEKRGNQLIEMKEYEAAANKFTDISNYFREALGSLESLLDSSESEDTILNAKARFTHFIAEYLTVAALCLRASEDRKFNEKIKMIGKEAIDLFQQAIDIQKNYLFQSRTDFDKEIIYRISFDAMLLEIIQSILGVNEVNSIEFLLKDGDDHRVLFKKIKDTPYFKLTKRIQKAGLLNILNDLENTHLGHFESLKNTLIKYFRK